MIKKLWVLLMILVLFIHACSKDENTDNQSLVNYEGTYIGNVSVYINNSFHSNQSKTITLTTTSTAGRFLMTNNIFMSTTCNISSSNLDIPIATTASSSSFNVVEYGTGTFSGNNLTIEFHQNQVNPTTNAIMGTGKWIGTLMKQ
jgi:hypothetical protein